MKCFECHKECKYFGLSNRYICDCCNIRYFSDGYRLYYVEGLKFKITTPMHYSMVLWLDDKPMKEFQHDAKNDVNVFKEIFEFKNRYLKLKNFT